MAGQESITGGQCTLSLTAANAAAGNFPDVFAAGTSFKITYTPTYEEHNDLGDRRTRSQQTKQKIAFSAVGRDIGGFKMALAKHQSASFLGGRGTPKYHLRCVGAGSDGRFTHYLRWCTLMPVDVDYSGQDKGGVETIAFDAEEIDE